MESKQLGIIKSILLSELDSNPFAARLSFPRMETLAGSLKNYGQLSLVKVRPNPLCDGRYQIVFGHMRVAAAKSLGWSSIMAEVSNVPDELMISFALTENLDRNNYTDYEIGLLLRKLNEEFSKSITDISILMGRSKAYVSDHIAMTHIFDDCSLDTRDKDNLLSKLSEHQARILSRIPDPTRRVNAARLAIDEKLGVKELERLLGHSRQNLIQSDSSLIERKKEISHNMIQDEEEITSMIESIIHGLSNRDLRPLQSYRSSRRFSLFDEFPPFLDLLNYDRAIEHNFNTVKQMDTFALDYSKLRINVLGEFAYATFLVTYRIRHLGKWSTGRSRVTMVLSKENSKWMSLHEHWSALEFEFAKALHSLETSIQEKKISFLS
jgi:ParB/RepB/Spo0J family partition protein